MPSSNTTQARRSAVIREVDGVIEAYLHTLDSMRNAVKAHEAGDTNNFTSEREKAYECLSALLDGVNIEPLDLADSFRQVHLQALRLIWSKAPEQWQTAIRMIQRLYDSCHESRVKATERDEQSAATLS